MKLAPRWIKQVIYSRTRRTRPLPAPTPVLPHNTEIENSAASERHIRKISGFRSMYGSTAARYAQDNDRSDAHSDLTAVSLHSLVDSSEPTYVVVRNVPMSRIVAILCQQCGFTASAERGDIIHVHREAHIDWPEKMAADNVYPTDLTERDGIACPQCAERIVTLTVPAGTSDCRWLVRQVDNDTTRVAWVGVVNDE